ncbi:MAG: hypothetical protein JNL95_05650 [Chitinophagales bacterium]|jgi:hypothetical protein|nr:hypothetical protein [Chitinophagales bacterium]MBP6516746.1 hypothetical protein [Chitinophagales bacterium]
MKAIFLSASLLLGASAFAQSNDVLAANNNETKKTEETAPMPIKAQELKVSLKNGSERKVAVYVGPKKDVFSGKGEALGGLSLNTYYLVPGDIICIMDDPKTIHACSILKEGTTKVEINSSGNGFIK